MPGRSVPATVTTIEGVLATLTHYDVEKMPYVLGDS